MIVKKNKYDEGMSALEKRILHPENLQPIPSLEEYKKQGGLQGLPMCIFWGKKRRF